VNYDISNQLNVSSARVRPGNPTPIPTTTEASTAITDALVRSLVNVDALEATAAISDIRPLANLVCATKALLDMVTPAGVRPMQFYNAFTTDTGWVIVDPVNAVYCTADADISIGSQVFGFDAGLYAALQAAQSAGGFVYYAFAAPAWSIQTPFWGRFVGSVVEVD